MAQHVGWRSFFWLNVALLGVVLVLLIFFFPETKWHRVHPKEILQGQEASDNAINGTQANESDLEKPTQVRQETLVLERDPYLGRGYPSKRQFNIYQCHGQSIKTLLLNFWIPFKLHLFPIIEFAAFVVSWAASCFLTINLTQSQAFAAPPYNFSSQTIGFFNFAVWIGSFIGLATNGPLSDWISMRATKKNRGIREPEMRLSAMIPYLIISILGNFIVAFGYQYKWDWRVSFTLMVVSFMVSF